MGFEIGQVVGGYAFEETLHHARIGIMYRVFNQAANRVEILRVLPKEVQDDKEQVDRFLREMKVHARLAHPNIVAFYSAFEIDGQLVTTTEWVDGPRLAKKLEDGPLILFDGIVYLCQALSALGYAHRHGVVHREIAT
ncbi:MAG: protein kinase domain-containing protein, partial [Bryobacteraceae bacterium]